MRRNEMDLASQVVRNIITNPAMVTKTAGTETVLVNYAANPTFEGATHHTGPIGANQATFSTSGIATDRAHTGTKSYKLGNCTVAGQANRKAMTNPTGALKVMKGQKLSWSFWIYSTVSGLIIPYWEGRKVSDNSYTGGGVNQVSIPANKWTYIAVTSAPVTVDSYVDGAGGYGLPVNVGDSVWFDDFCITKTDTPVPYFDGSTPAADGYVHSWEGTAHQSSSLRKAAATIVRTNLVANPSFKGGTLSNIRTNLLTNPSFENSTATTDVWTNHVTNPSFRTTNGTVETRRNLVTNPSFETAAGTIDVRTNLATNPSMEATGSTATVRTNLATNPSFETTTGAATTVRTNLVTNPSFEVDTAGWTTNHANYVLTRDTTTSYSGGASGKVTITIDGFSGGVNNVSAPITVTAGQVVTASAWVKASRNMPIAMMLRFRAADMSTNTGDFTGTAITANGNWQRISFTYTAPASSERVFLQVQMNGSSLNGDAYWVDDALLESGNKVLPYFDGANPISNLCTNPSFQTGTTGWAGKGTTNPTFAVDGGQAFTGTLSLKVTAQATTSAGIGFTVSGLTVGKTYTMSGWIYSPSGQPNVISTVTSVGYGTQVTTKDAWTRIAMTWVATSTSHQIGFDFNGTLAVGGHFFLDAVMLTSTDSAIPYFEGNGDFSYSWTGTANNSTSVQTSNKVAGFTHEYYCVPVSSSDWTGTVGTKSLRIVPTTDLSESFVSLIGSFSGFGSFIAGKTYTVAATLRLAEPLTGTLYSRALSICFRDNNGRTQYVSGTNTTGEQRLKLTFTVPSTGTTYGFIELFNGASFGNGDVWWDDIVVEESAPLQGISGQYFDGSNAPVNLCTNPSFETDTSNWQALGSATLLRDSLVYHTGRASLRVATTATNTGALFSMSSVATKYYTISAYVYVATGQTISFAVDGVHAPYQTITGTSSWQRVSLTARAKGNTIPVYFRSTIASQTFWVDAVLIEKGHTLSPYFDSSTMSDFTHAWSTTANSSSSIQQATLVATGGMYNAAGASSTVWKNSGTRSLRVVPMSGSQDTYTDIGGDVGGLRTGMAAGRTYTVSATVRLSAPLTGSIHSRSRKIVVFTRDGAAAYVEHHSNQAPNASGETRVSVTFTVPTGGTEAFIRLYHGGYKESGDIWYDNLLIEESPVLRPYFDGTIPAHENLAKSAPYAYNGLTTATNVSFAGQTWTRGIVAAGPGTGAMFRQMVDLNSLRQGERYTTSVTVANDQSTDQTVWMDFSDTSLASFVIKPGEIRRISVYGSRTDHDTTFRFSDLHIIESATESRSILIKDWLIEVGDTTGSYYYTGTGDFTYAWTGTANASTSVQRATQVTGVSGVPSLCRAFQSSYGATAGSKTVRVMGTSTSTDVFAEIAGTFTSNSFKANTTYTMSADRILTAPLVGASGTIVRVNIGTELSITTITSPTNVAGRSRLVVRFTTGSDTTLNFIRLYSSTPAGGGDAWFDRVVVEEGFTDGSYFDGTTPAYQNLFTNPSVESTNGVNTTVNTNFLLNPLGRLSTSVDVGPNVTVVHNGTSGVVVTHKSGVAAGNAFYAAHCNITSGITYYARAVLEDVTGTPAATAGIHSNVGAHVGSQATMTRVGSTLVREWSFTSNHTGLARLLIDYSGAGTGESFRVKEMIVADRPLDETKFFDGSTPAGGGYTYAWTGTANASTSTRTAQGATTWNLWAGGTGAATGFRLTSGGFSGSSFYRTKWYTSQSGSNLGGAFVDASVVGGTVYSTRVKARVSRAQTLRLSIEWYAPSGAFISTSSGVDVAVTANTWTDLKLENVTAPSYATLGRVTVYAAALGTPWSAGDTLDTDAAVFEAGATARLFYEGTGDFTYAWVGTADASASTQKAVAVLGNVAAKSSGVGYTDARFMVYQSTDENGDKISRWFSPAGSPNSQWRVANITAAAFDHTALVAGTTYTLLMRYRSSGWGVQNFQVSLKDATSLNPITTDETRSLNTGWTEYRRTFTASINGLASTNLYISLPVTPQATTDGIFDVAEWALVQGDYKGPFFDGTSVSSSPDMSYLWLGTADASKTVLRGNQVNDVVTANFGDNNAKPITSTEWTASTGKSMRLIPVGPGSDTSITLHGSSSSGLGSMVAGKTYTVKATFRQAAPQTGTLHSRARGIMFADSVVGWAAAPVVAATNTAGSQTLTHTFTVNSAATWATVRLYNGASGGNGDVWWDDVVLVEGPYTGDYFDGNTAASGDFTHAWAGTANASVSYQKALNLSGWSTENKLTAWITSSGTLRLEVKDHTGGGGRSIVPWQSQDVTMSLVTGNKYTIKARGKKLDSGTSYRIAGNLVGELPLTTSMSDITVTLTAGSGPTYLEHPGRMGAGTEWEYFGIFTEGDPVVFFDGDTTGFDGLTHRWKGTPNVSQSEQIGSAVSSFTEEAFIKRWALSDGAMRTVNITGSSHSLQTASVMTAGRTYTVLFRAKSYRSGTAHIYGFGNYRPVALTSSYEWYRITGVADGSKLYFSTIATSGAGFDISHMMITEGTYTGGYIDGSSYGSVWTGTANASASIGNSMSLEALAGKPLFSATAAGNYPLSGGMATTDPRTIYTVVSNVVDLPTSLDVIMAYGSSSHDDVVPNTYLTVRQQAYDGPENQHLVRRTGGGGPWSLFRSSGSHILISGISPESKLFSGVDYSELVIDPLVVDIPHEKLAIMADSAYHKHVITYIYAGFHDNAQRAHIVKLLAQKHGVDL